MKVQPSFCCQFLELLNDKKTKKPRNVDILYSSLLFVLAKRLAKVLR